MAVLLSAFFNSHNRIVWLWPKVVDQAEALKLLKDVSWAVFPVSSPACYVFEMAYVTAWWCTGMNIESCKSLLFEEDIAKKVLH